MRSALVWLRRRWQLPVLEAIDEVRRDMAALGDELQAVRAHLGEIDGRLDQLDADVAADAEALAERIVAERRRHARLAADLDDLRARVPGS